MTVPVGDWTRVSGALRRTRNVLLQSRPLSVTGCRQTRAVDVALTAADRSVCGPGPSVVRGRSFTFALGVMCEVHT